MNVDSPEMSTKFASEMAQLLEQKKEDRYKQVNRFYLLIIFSIILAWILGAVGASASWNLFICAALFLIWKGKITRLTEELIRQSILHQHRRRALSGSETCEWLNFLLNRWWLFSSESIFDILKRKLDYDLAQRKPTFLECIELKSFTLGDQTPHVSHVRVFEFTEGMPGGKKTASCSTITDPPKQLYTANQYQLVLEIDVGLHCQDFKMIFSTSFKNLKYGPEIALENLSIEGKMQLVCQLDMSVSFPHIGSVTATFISKPDLWFSLRVNRSLHMMEIPIIRQWLHNLVTESISSALVDPGLLNVYKADINVRPTKKSNIRAAVGVLNVTVISQISPNAIGNLSNITNQLQICTVGLGDQSRVSHEERLCVNQAWQQNFSLLVYDLQSDVLSVKIKNKSLLGLSPLVTLRLALVDFTLSNQSIVSHEEQQGAFQINVRLEYFTLKPIELQKYIGEPYSVYGVSGVIQVHMHSASNLLAMDRNGLSDPYCIMFANRKKICTTHYICKTLHPKWEVFAEFLVQDFTTTILSFFLYDWDGRDVTEDDFLGSAQLQLKQEQPAMVYESLELGYNIVNVGKVSGDRRFGSLIVSAVFRPVASIAPDQTFVQPLSNAEITEMQGKINRKGVTAKYERGDSMAIGALLSKGCGIMEMHIVAARNLVAKDIGGTSDPYVEIRIGKEVVFKSSVKKRNLNPKWDEWVTSRLPTENEKMHVILYDKDPIGKDFLGEYTFSQKNIRELCSAATAQWFRLNKTKSGEVKLGCKIISDGFDVKEEENKRGVILSSLNAMIAEDSNEEEVHEDHDDSIIKMENKEDEEEKKNDVFVNEEDEMGTEDDVSKVDEVICESHSAMKRRIENDALFDQMFQDNQQEVNFNSLWLAVTGIRGINSQQIRGAIYVKVKLDPSMHFGRNIHSRQLYKSENIRLLPHSGLQEVDLPFHQIKFDGHARFITSSSRLRFVVKCTSQLPQFATNNLVGSGHCLASQSVSLIDLYDKQNQETFKTEPKNSNPGIWLNISSGGIEMRFQLGRNASNESTKIRRRASSLRSLLRNGVPK